ncbi:MAG: hypothetical protein L0H93_11275 [Nocardioides sp.]|nr:hypothetical protein [Nocardioides sp.]
MSAQTKRRSHHHGTGKTSRKTPGRAPGDSSESSGRVDPPRQELSGRDDGPVARRRFNPLPWAVCLFLAFAHTAAAARVSTYGGGGDALVVLILPAIVTAALIPQARRRGWVRWVSVWVLSYIVMPEFAAPTVAVAETWILHRFWVVEFPDNHASRWLKNRIARWKKTPAEEPRS